jgi:hypothetical protein
MQVVLVLGTYWKFNGGMREYVEWSATAETINDFYDDPGASEFTSIGTHYT